MEDYRNSGSYGRSGKGKENEQKYSETCKFIKKKCNEAKEKWINDHCIEIENRPSKTENTCIKKLRKSLGRMHHLEMDV